MSRRILVVDDDDGMAHALCKRLVFEGFIAERARTVPEAMVRLQSFAPDLLILDLTLPGGDGLDICRDLVRRRVRPPIIILSARGQSEDKILGLKLGADDYVGKPFDTRELLARIDAVLRRSAPGVERLALGDLDVDFKKLTATRAGKPLPLSHREFLLLQYLAERAGKLVTREELLQVVWGYREAPLTRAVDIAIARLRRKIEPDFQHPRYIRTLHGDGYCLMP